MHYMGKYIHIYSELVGADAKLASNFPEFYPEDCPYAEAIEMDIVVYRYAARGYVCEKDFQSYYEKYPNRDFGQNECVACGVSVYKNMSDLTTEDKSQRTALMRRKANQKRILRIHITPKLGRVVPTSNHGDSHHTWWVYFDADPAPQCQVIKVGAKNE